MLARGNLERLANLDNQASASSIAALQMLDRCCSLHHLLRWRQCEAVIIFLAVGYYLIAQFDQDAKFSTGTVQRQRTLANRFFPKSTCRSKTQMETLSALRWLKNCWRQTISMPMKRP